MASRDWASLEEAIIAACDQHEREKRRGANYRRCIVFEGVFVKFDYYGSLYPQYRMQRHLTALTENDKTTPRVPKVYHFFRRRMAYLVMEYIELMDVSDEKLVHETAQAVRWMRHVPVPENVVMGPLEGPVRHTIFRDFEAPSNLSTVEELENFLNIAVGKFPKRVAVAPISIVGEPLVLTQSDFDKSNFGVDGTGRGCIFDFCEFGWLPKPFEEYTLTSTTDFARAVAKDLGIRRSDNLASMGNVRWILNMSA